MSDYIVIKLKMWDFNGFELKSSGQNCNTINKVFKCKMGESGGRSLKFEKSAKGLKISEGYI